MMHTISTPIFGPPAPGSSRCKELACRAPPPDNAQCDRPDHPPRESRPRPWYFLAPHCPPSTPPAPTANRRCPTNVPTTHPPTPGGDSGELIAVSHVLGVPHPPGYPTFTLVNKLFTTLIPVGTVAWKSNLLAAICASGAGLFLHLSVVELTNSLAAGVLAAGLFSFARLQWLYSITGEVFAMNNLFCAVLMHQTVRYQRSPTLCKACLGAFTCGLALTNQHTTILYIIIIAPWVLWRGGNIGDIGEPAAAPAKGGSGTSTAGGGLLRPGPVAALTACALLGLSPYIFTYLSALRNTASLTWGDQRTLPGFWKHLSREEYGTFDLAKGNRESASFWRAIEVSNSPGRRCTRPSLVCWCVFLVFFFWWASFSLSLLHLVLVLSHVSAAVSASALASTSASACCTTVPHCRTTASLTATSPIADAPHGSGGRDVLDLPAALCARGHRAAQTRAARRQDPHHRVAGVLHGLLQLAR